MINCLWIEKSVNMFVNCVLIYFEKMYVNCLLSKGIGDDMFVY